MPVQRNVTVLHATKIFCSFTVYFYLLLFFLFPFLKNNYNFHPAVYWFITGYFLFIPLFLYAIIFAGKDSKGSLYQALNLKKFSSKDWKYAIWGLLLSFTFTGIIFGISTLLHHLGIANPLDTTPWFMEMRPFVGMEKLLLLVWFPMFFFNIVGEELIWRGYLQSRMTGKFTWLICTLLWAVFHIPFGFDLIIMASPVLIIIPYIFSKTQNTSIGIFIHGIYNGPIFILISLGIIH